MSKQKPYTITAIREAHWIVAQLAPGTPWAAGAFTHASTEPALIRMGVLVATDNPQLFTVNHPADLPALPARSAR